MRDKWQALLERLRPCNILPDVPSNNPYHYTLDCIIEESGITDEELENLPADALRGVGTVDGHSVLLFDKDALAAWIDQQYPQATVSEPWFQTYTKGMGRG